MAASLDQACKRVGGVQFVPSELPESAALSMCGLHGAVHYWVEGPGEGRPMADVGREVLGSAAGPGLAIGGGTVS